jgi:hypothetical protein
LYPRWWIKRWVFQRRDAVLEPLYTFDTITNHQDRINALHENDRKRSERRVENAQIEQESNSSDHELSDEKVVQ